MVHGEQGNRDMTICLRGKKHYDDDESFYESFDVKRPNAFDALDSWGDSVLRAGFASTGLDDGFY